MPARPLLARGRDADIFDLGDGKILRQARNGRSLAAEAEVMAHAADHGVPVPRVYEVTGDGAIVMDRVDGPTLLDVLTQQPWRAGEVARVLAELHASVHRVPAPAGLASVDADGSSLLHLDLHPANIIATPVGPALIDWANARAGSPAADLAMTWILLATGSVEGAALKRLAIGVLRRLLVRSFLHQIDTDTARSALGLVATRRLADRNVRPDEATRVRALADRYAR